MKNLLKQQGQNSISTRASYSELLNYCNFCHDFLSKCENRETIGMRQLGVHSIGYVLRKSKFEVNLKTRIWVKRRCLELCPNY